MAHLPPPPNVRSFAGITTRRKSTDLKERLQSKTASEAGCEPDDLGSCVTALVNVITKAMAEEVEPFGVTPVEFALLRMCMLTGTTTGTDLAVLLPIDGPRISRVADKLVGQGMITRRRSRTDRRVVHLDLTREGKELTADLVQRVDARNAAMLEGVTQGEMSDFISTTRKVLANCANCAVE